MTNIVTTSGPQYLNSAEEERETEKKKEKRLNSSTNTPGLSGTVQVRCMDVLRLAEAANNAMSHTCSCTLSVK